MMRARAPTGRLALPANAVLDGNYRIARVVGSGGFGITYEAEDVSLGTTVALKEYYPVEFGDRDATMRVRPRLEKHKPVFEWGRANFLEEARTLARLDHPGILPSFDQFDPSRIIELRVDFTAGQPLLGVARNLFQHDITFGFDTLRITVRAHCRLEPG